MRMLQFIITNFLLISLLSSSVLAGEFSLPAYVTPEMGEPSYWAGEAPDEVLATPEEIQALSKLYVNTDATMMTDLTQVPTVFNGKNFIEGMWGQLYSSASNMMNLNLYNETDEALTGKELSQILENIDNGKNTDAQKIVYGICTRRTSLKAFPTDRLMTTTKGDYEDDYNQNALILVNEPVLIMATSLDGEFYYCNTTCYSGWVHSSDIAICADREEWLSAWSFPAEETLVVTGSKIILDDSGFNPAVSGLQLSMGTTLQKVPQSEIGTNINGRFPFFNYVVYLPIRNEDGTYERTMGLIAKHQEVSEGYLPLTTSNLLTVAFSALGDVYGWGGMLSSMDCSTFVRCIYRCFGLTLALNTTWQMAMPGYKIDLSGAKEEIKQQILSALKPGAILFFNGHEMLYVGEKNGRYYCISAVGNMLDASARGQSNIRTITLNTLDVTRWSGHTWMEDIDTVLIPYLPEETVLEEIEVIKAQAEVEAAAPSDAQAEGEEAIDVDPAQATDLTGQEDRPEGPAPESLEDELAGPDEEVSVEDVEQLLGEMPQENDSLNAPPQDVINPEMDVEAAQDLGTPEGAESIVVLDYTGNEFDETDEELPAEPSQEDVEAGQALREELFMEELENPEAAAIRSQLEMATAFLEEDILPQVKEAQDQKYILVYDSPLSETESSEEIKGIPHFLVDTDGSVVQMAPLNEVLPLLAWETLEFSKEEELEPIYGAVLVELALEDGEEPTQEQLKALDLVIAYINAYYGFESKILPLQDEEDTLKKEDTKNEDAGKKGAKKEGAVKEGAKKEGAEKEGTEKEGAEKEDASGESTQLEETSQETTAEVATQETSSEVATEKEASTEETTKE